MIAIRLLLPALMLAVPVHAAPVCLSGEQIEDRAVEIVLAETCGRRDEARQIVRALDSCETAYLFGTGRLDVLRRNALHTGCPEAISIRSPNASPRSLDELLGR